MYSYVLDGDVVENVLALSAKQRDELIQVFRQLAENPFEKGETVVCDSVGREIQRKKFGHWFVSFWADHAVKELRIIGIQRARR